jgi:hypothetical protein
MGQCMMQWTIYVHGKFQIEQDFVHGEKKRQTSILINKWLRVLMCIQSDNMMILSFYFSLHQLETLHK